MLLPVPGKVLNRVILDRLKAGVDAKLRDHQAGFRQSKDTESKSCIHHVEYNLESKTNQN